MLQLSVVHRLPQRFRWVSEHHSAVEIAEAGGLINDADVVALRLISHDGSSAWEILRQLQATLRDIQIECRVAECGGYPCLLVPCGDESTTNCCLKNQGVAIAETFPGH
ncbi:MULTISPECIES: hypothetical protein [Pantoea]|uniref:YejG-like protein n=1 Tax=Candidatus Pantoea multigeneris TaxID=2608357 RepID=A0ABX0RC57_9GAMM|nr:MULTISPECIES: hypothetical protein [Pantoea]NIF22940.1 hypothetical protein [Pantoea multigeneris]